MDIKKSCQERDRNKILRFATVKHEIWDYPWKKIVFFLYIVTERQDWKPQVVIYFTTRLISRESVNLCRKNSEFV